MARRLIKNKQHKGLAAGYSSGMGMSLSGLAIIYTSRLFKKSHSGSQASYAQNPSI